MGISLQTASVPEGIPPTSKSLMNIAYLSFNKRIENAKWSHGPVCLSQLLSSGGSYPLQQWAQGQGYYDSYKIKVLLPTV